MTLSDTPSELLDTLARPFRGAIFDCDGTLADTMALHYRAWVQALDARQAQMSEQLFYDLAGVPTTRIVEILNERYGFALDVDATAEEKEQLYEELLPQAQPIERVVALVHAYHGKYPMAVASGGIRRLVDRTVAGLGLTDYFEAVCTAEDVVHGKPAPDLFLLAASKIGVAPEECVVFEDSDLGLEAAARAGMQGVDIRPWLNPAGSQPE